MSLTESSDSWQIHSEVSEAYTLEGHRGLEIDSTLMRFGRKSERENRAEEGVTCVTTDGVTRPGVYQLPLVAVASIALEDI